MRKFIDPKVRSAAEGTTTYKQYRLAEIYLNLAEAENEANGHTPEACNAVNTVRARAGMPGFPEGLTQDEFRERGLSQHRRA